LDALRAGKVAIIWTDLQRMLVRGLPDLLTATLCLVDVARLAASRDSGISVPTNLIILGVGVGPNFPPFSSGNCSA
jgi:hypothetical protein